MTTKNQSKTARKNNKKAPGSDAAPESGEGPLSSRTVELEEHAPVSGEGPASGAAIVTDGPASGTEPAPVTARPEAFVTEDDEVCLALAKQADRLTQEIIALKADESLSFKQRRDRVRQAEASRNRIRADILARRSQAIADKVGARLAVLAPGSASKRIVALSTRRHTPAGEPLIQLASMSGLPLTGPETDQVLDLLASLGVFERLADKPQA